MTATSDTPQADVPALQPRPRRRRRERGRTTRKGLLVTYLILVPGALLFVAPFAWLVSASFQSMGTMFSWPPDWIPDHPTLNGYTTFLGFGDDARSAESADAWKWFANSAFVASSVTILQLFFNSLAAYAFAKRQFPRRDLIFMLFLATMMVPGQVTQIFIMTNGGPVHRTTTMVFYIYEAAFKFYEMGYASTLAYGLFALLFVFTLLQMRLYRRANS